jgi:hypothetical protein
LIQSPYLPFIRFDSKYSQIDKLFIDGWSIEELKKVVLSETTASDTVSLISPGDRHEKTFSVDSQDVTERVVLK